MRISGVLIQKRYFGLLMDIIMFYF